MLNLFNEVSRVIEREFYDEDLILNQWSDMRETYRQQFAQTATSEEKEAVRTRLIEQCTSGSSVSDKGIIRCLSILAIRAPPRRVVARLRQSGSCLVLYLIICLN